MYVFIERKISFGGYKLFWDTLYIAQNGMACKHYLYVITQAKLCFINFSCIRIRAVSLRYMPL